MDSAMNVESKSQADASIGELVSQLSSQTSRLVRDEMKLAPNEFVRQPNTPASAPVY